MRDQADGAGFHFSDIVPGMGELVQQRDQRGQAKQQDEGETTRSGQGRASGKM